MELEVEVAIVMVFDEEADSCTLLTRVLQRMGHEVFAFGNRNEASDWARTNVSDMAIVNIRGRYNEGFPTLARLKEINCNLKVLVITNVFSDELSKKWFADDFLIKPLDIDEVEVKVRKLLARKRAEIHNS